MSAPLTPMAVTKAAPTLLGHSHVAATVVSHYPTTEGLA